MKYKLCFGWRFYLVCGILDIYSFTFEMMSASCRRRQFAESVWKTDPPLSSLVIWSVNVGMPPERMFLQDELSCELEYAAVSYAARVLPFL